MYCDKFRGVGEKAISEDCVLQFPVHTRVGKV